MWKSCHLWDGDWNVCYSSLGIYINFFYMCYGQAYCCSSLSPVSGFSLSHYFELGDSILTWFIFCERFLIFFKGNSHFILYFIFMFSNWEVNDGFWSVWVFHRYASIRAIETKSPIDDQQWLTYWVLYSLITLFELTFAKLIEW